MGLFMDRHDMPADAKMADVAAAHMKDVEIQERYGVRFLTYWFDYERHRGFCLVDAPSPEVAIQVHREAHGLLPGAVIPVEREAVEMFLGRIDDPLEAGRDPEGGFRAIMFTDIEASTELTQRIGDAAALELLREHDRIVRGALDVHEGREVKHTGDGFMASFASVTQAVHCAVTIQRALLVRESTDDKTSLRVRIGISAGEPVEHHGDLFGSTVNLAARLCTAAEPGSIVVSNAVRELALGKQLPFREPRTVMLKGFEEPQSCSEVMWHQST